LFLVIAGLGFTFHGTHAEPSLLLGVFPINGLHNLVHLLIGFGGVLAFVLGRSASVVYARVVGTLYIALGILGVFFPTGFGLVPIGGADIALHLVMGTLALWAGTVGASHELSKSAGTTRIPR
jgi:hypothetical protein